jgi:hypothetical protein
VVGVGPRRQARGVEVAEVVGRLGPAARKFDRPIGRLDHVALPKK